jgi:hypothetical protein
VHKSVLAPTTFNPGKGAPGRFHPFQNAAKAPVPTLYVAESIGAVLSETVFHDVPRDGKGENRIVSRRKIEPLAISMIRPMRDLKLTQLRDPGLRKLRLSQAELIDTESDHYLTTVKWAAYFHRNGCDGLIWMSRQFNSSAAMVLFGDRVIPSDLAIVQHPLLLSEGAGFAAVLQAAEDAGIMIAQ